MGQDPQESRESKHIEGFCIVRRARQPLPAKRGKIKTGAHSWTAHRAECQYLHRVKTEILAAPATPYPNTVACQLCKPPTYVTKGASRAR